MAIDVTLCLMVSLIQDEPTQCDSSRECTFQVTKKKGKGEMKNPGVSTYEKEQTEKASNASFHHVSPNSQFHESFVKDPQRREAVSGLGYENANYLERKTQEHFGGESSASWHRPNHYGGESSSSWRRPAYETMFKGPEVLKEKHNILFGNCARTPIQWSEEELDFLWLGVRRHGQNNWNTILTDTNLCFLKSRVAEDLAEQWAKERKKIVNEVFYEPRKFTRPVHPPSTFATKTAANSHYYGSNILPTNSEFTQCNGETRRSIGDIFFQSMNNFNCTSPNPSSVTIAEPISFRPPPGPFLAGNLVRSGYPMAGNGKQLNRFTLPNQTYPFRPSNWCQNSVETPAWRNQCSPSVPDWFVNTFNKYQENSESPSAASCFRQYMPKNEGQTPSFPKYGNPPVPPNNSHGHGLLKRKNLAYGELDGNTTIQYMPLKERQTSSFLNHGDPPAPPNNSHGRGLLKRMSMVSSDCSGSMKMHGNLVLPDEVQMQNGSSMFSSIGLTFKKPALSDSGKGLNDGLNLSLKCSATAEPSEASTEDTVSDSGNKTR